MDFVKDLEVTHIAGVGERGSHVVCVIMTHCVRKSICDSPHTFEKMEPRNYD